MCVGGALNMMTQLNNGKPHVLSYSNKCGRSSVIPPCDSSLCVKGFSKLLMRCTFSYFGDGIIFGFLVYSPKFA